ncbi:AAA family ATPase [Mycolicibacter virginiensis]|uniref:AAA family ATPase n=1 Tax=Mycolicibacter virginiensis TaxID=1795032 RepID=UPI001F0412A4|nr:AAA family ATPase [Mycolicibacter virginiensis]ULP48051.1 AAA family ATPase [Mycolicibacter virginiensis]
MLTDGTAEVLASTEFAAEFGFEGGTVISADELGAALRGIAPDEVTAALAVEAAERVWGGDERRHAAERRALKRARAARFGAQLASVTGADADALRAVCMNAVADAAPSRPEPVLDANADAGWFAATCNPLAVDGGYTDGGISHRIEAQARHAATPAVPTRTEIAAAVTAPEAAIVAALAAVPPAPIAPEPDQDELVLNAAAFERRVEAEQLREELRAFLARDPSNSEHEIAALMAMTVSDRAEVASAAKAGRLTRLGLTIRSLGATMVGSTQAWIRLREGVLTESRFVDGGSFIHSIPETTPAVWGSGEDVLWAEGEALVIAGPQGVGKSTMAGSLVLGMLNGGSDFLGYPVKRVDRVLYLAMDRPRQIARALRRQLGGIPEAELAQRLVVWQGPPPEDLAAHPDRLAAMCAEKGAQVVVIDSLKDAALGLATDEVGAGWNRARQTTLAAGVEVLELHHDRKTTDAAAPAIEKLYGSIWITSGAGSVIHLGGEPGDPVVKFRHLKQPSTEVAPFEIAHDGSTGTMTVHAGVDLLDLCRQPGGASAAQCASALFETDRPSSAEREKARRRLEKLRESGSVHRADVAGMAVYTAVNVTAVRVP